MITHKIKPLTFNNTYTLTKRNVLTGEEEAHEFHNVILNNFGYLAGRRSRAALFGRCYLGSGSGIPSASDTGLFHSLFYNPQNPTYSSKRAGDKKDFTFSYVFPASSSYVGTITEVGLVDSQSGYFVTHALVTDSEGNPISIEKTNIDEVIVTVKISVERPNFSSGQTWAFEQAWLKDGYSFGMSGAFINGYYYSGYQGAKLSYGWSPELTHDGTDPSLESISSSQSNGKVSCSFEWDSQVSFVGFVNSILVGKTNGPSSGDYGGAAFHLLFPNSSVFPTRHLTNLSLGTGDGETTDFVPEIPMWVEDTEVVYKDGVALERGVDYLVDSVSNPEKSTSYGLGTFVCEIKNDHSYSGNYQGVYYFGMKTGSISFGGYEHYASPMVLLNHETPIIFEYAQEFSFTSKVNALRIGSWSIKSGSTNNRWPAGTSMIFETSSDGEIFEEIFRSTLRSQNYGFSDSEYHFIEELSSVKFLRIRLELPSGANPDSYKGQWLYCTNGDSYFGYIGEYAIRFVNPPEEGAVLTVDLSIDRPYKSANNIIQYNPEFNF